MWAHLSEELQKGNQRALARAISLVENEVPGYEELLCSLPASNIPVVGITGPPGAGKSTLVDALIGELVKQGKKVGVCCVDPSSPFNLGALLGDRIRMSNWYNHPDVFIRSLASRGSLGGLHPKIIEITDLFRAMPLDLVVVETVGVGQSEVEIAGLADVTVVTVVPEAGDEVQTMKAGLMEIADIFVVNKSDRPDADLFVKNLKAMLMAGAALCGHAVPVIKTIASRQEGIHELMKAINELTGGHQSSSRQSRQGWLLAEKAYHLIQQRRMKDVNKADLKMKIDKAGKNFNLYRFIQNYV